MTVWWRVDGSQTEGANAIFEFEVAPTGTMPVPHFHNEYDEVVYGLEGHLVYTVDGTAFDVRPGNALVIKRGQVHGFENVGDAPARGLAIVTPGILRPNFFREMGEALERAADGTPPTVEIGEIMQRYGITPVPGGAT